MSEATTPPGAPTVAPTPWTANRMPAIALIPVAGLVWWIVGFAPWLLGGLGDQSRGESPMAVPLFAGNVSALVLGGGVGGLAAGLLTIAARGPLLHRAAAASAGVLVTLTVALVESRRALDQTGLGGFDTDDRVANGLSVIVVVMTVIGLSVGLLALGGRVGTGFALAGVAGAAPAWLSGVLHAIDKTLVPGEPLMWAGAAVLAVALVIVGLAPAARLTAWLGLVLLAWVVGPTVTAAVYIEPLLRPGAGLPDTLGDHVAAAVDVWQLAMAPDARPLTPWLVAIIIAAIVSWIRRASRSAAASPVE